MLESEKRGNERILLLFFVILTTQGILSTIAERSFFLVDPTTQLEISFFIIGLLNFNPLSQNHFIIFVTFSIICFASILLSQNVGTSYYDSIRAVKWLAYLSIIWSTSTKIYFNMGCIIRIYKIVIAAAVFCYFIQFFRNGFGSRPVLFVENNFEISLFAGLLVIIHTYGKLTNESLKIKWYLALILVIALSGSRSGALTGIVVTFFVTRDLKVVRKWKLLKNSIRILAVSIMIFTFVTRGATISETDRYTFLEVFFSETKGHSLYRWVFGNFMIRPLSDSGCATLSYYQILVSDHVYGTCYSVILHSFILRIVWDFGIIGLVVSFGAIFLRIRKRLPHPLPHILTILAFANAASVSGPNNVYVIFPLLIAILTEKHFTLSRFASPSKGFS